MQDSLDSTDSTDLLDSDMTFFDFLVLALVASSVISGALRGIVRALVTGAALIIGLLIAARGYGVVSAIIRGIGLVQSKETANAFGFLFIVLASFAAGFFAGQLISKGLRRLHLEWLDRLLGGAFGLLRGWAVCSVLYLALTAFPVHLSSVTGAQTAPLLAAGAKMLGVFTSPEVRTRFYKSYTDLLNSK
ncbi:MAG TPA: CvpA family protein [Pyrinomonadaceae bacterium]